MEVRRIERLCPLLAFVVGWLSVTAAWLASAPAVLAANQALRLSDVALDPRVLVVSALLLAAAWLGFGGRRRRGHRRR